VAWNCPPSKNPNKNDRPQRTRNHRGPRRQAERHSAGLHPSHHLLAETFNIAAGFVVGWEEGFGP